ncbi:AMP-binding protein [Sciscionella marina]|uniref:AMP-binding protein n=1 Tax=Sciscionella marina TaxID=508770 RepID=UPI00036E3953|nr:AMP-binding protein [Sciscionella marina]
MTFVPEDGFPLCSIPRAYATDRPDQVAVRCGDEELTWSQLHRASNRVAHGLREHGVEPGRIVSLLLPNSCAAIVALFACYKVGAIPQPLSARLAEQERREILELADPGAVLEGTVAVDGLSGYSDADLPEVIAPSWKAPTSGGSTGRPKIILAGREAVYRGLDALVWGIEPGERLLLPAPLQHNAPLCVASYALFGGGTVTMLERFDPEATLAAVAPNAISWLYLVPTMMRRIEALSRSVRHGYDLSSLRMVWHVAAPCPPATKRAWIDWLGPERIWELYAGTEAQAGCTISGTEWLEHPGSVGAQTWGELALFDQDGARVTTPRTPGEVYTRVTPGEPASYRYIGAEAKELQGWASLGDIGEFDEDGYLYLHDRLTDMILVGGVNVYPAEVENAILEHPGALSCAVIGLPDGDLGSRVHAIVEAAGVTESELAAHLEPRLSAHKRPRTFELVTEPLRDDTGKVRRTALRAARM